MADGPINYSLNVQTPFEAAAGGLQLGGNLANIQSQIMARNKTQMLASDRQKLFQETMTALNQKGNQATETDYTSAANLFPEYSDKIRENFGLLSKGQQNEQLKFSGQILSALNAGQSKIGVDLLRQKSEAEKNSNRPDQADFYDRAAKLAESNPDQAKQMMSLILAAVPGGPEILKAQKVPSEVAVSELEPTKKEADIALTQAQTAELLSRINKNKGVEIKPPAQKIIDTEAQRAVDLRFRAGRQEELAGNFDKQIDKMGAAGWGKIGNVNEFMRKTFGQQNDLTALRQEYARIISKEVKEYLPVGNTTDKDMALALKGFPEDTSDVNYLSSFLKGMAKLQYAQADFSEANADWVSQAGGRGKMQEDTEVMGIPVSAGTSYPQFFKQLGKTLQKGGSKPPPLGPEQTATAQPFVPAPTPPGKVPRLTQPAPTTASNDKLKAAKDIGLGDYF